MAALIFSHQRCGSSNLLRFIRKACNARVGMETFNFKALDKECPDWRNVEVADLQSHLKSVLAAKDVVKHIYGQHRPEIDEIIASTPGTESIIFLYRQDIYASALSTLVARRLNHFNARASESLGIIPASQISDLANKVRVKRHKAIDMCLKSGRPVLASPYEFLFDPDMASRLHRARMVLGFLDQTAGIPSNEENFRLSFDEFLGDGEKINSIETYSHIENIDELRERFPSIFK